MPTPSLLHEKFDPCCFQTFSPHCSHWAMRKWSLTLPLVHESFTKFSHKVALTTFCTFLLYARLLHRRAVVVFILLSHSKFLHFQIATSSWDPPPTPHVAQSYLFRKRPPTSLSISIPGRGFQAISPTPSIVDTCFLTPIPPFLLCSMKSRNCFNILSLYYPINTVIQLFFSLSWRNFQPSFLHQKSKCFFWIFSSPRSPSP